VCGLTNICSLRTYRLTASRSRTASGVSVSVIQNRPESTGILSPCERSVQAADGNRDVDLDNANLE